MSTVVALILWFAVTCYAIFGGADYGAGFWDLTAGGARRGARARALIDHAMAPVWEANNVWLIFALVVLWTAFPRAFAAITSTLYLPLALAAAGIVLRGSGFVFRDATRALTGRRLFGAVFALSSVVTPFFLGASFGAIASGRVRAGDLAEDATSRWLGPTSILVGVLAVASAAFLAAVFLVFDAGRVDETLDRHFRWRAIGSGVATGLIAIAGLFVVRGDAPFLFHGLVHEGLPFVLLSGACGGAVVVLLAQDITRGTRALAVIAVVTMLAGWGVAQHPYLLPTSLTFEAAAGAPRSLGWLVVVFLIACVTAVPALALLFVLDQRSKLQHGSVVAGEHPESRHRVVVVGGGFGGLFATRALGWSPVDVTLVDREPHHLFQPLLYQVATGILSEGEIAPSLRHILRFQENAAVLLAEVTGFDLERHEVQARRPDGASITLPYDSLVVSAGAGMSYFGHDELAEHAPGMKTLDDALRLRRRLLQALEMAELSEDPRKQQGWLTVAIVGAGPTGVEIAGQVRALAVRSLGTSFRRIDPTLVRVVLLDAGHEPLSQFGDHLSEIAARELGTLGVELRMGVKVTAVDAESVVLEGANGPERIEARTVIWAAGVQASPLARLLAEASGAACDRAGRIETRPDCTLPKHPEVFAIGDMASLDRLPGVAEVAMQEGLHAARAIRQRVAGKPATTAFRYRDLGSMASVGRFRAVVSLKGLRVGGLLGWLTWAVVHLTFLTGFANRFATMFHWTRTFLGRNRSQIAFSARFTRTRPSNPR
ncbi:MAG TPA: cytochrome d ubiquinol oxidase subunit II [Polyangia bacterium]|jgi:NADH dehydrogenase|nr:cytochrome d ubiquinol oxidase subunit II [Polyangia bacterium]